MNMKKLNLLASVLLLAGCGTTFIMIQQEHQSNWQNWQNCQLGSPDNPFNNMYFVTAIALAREYQGYEACMVEY